MYVCCNFTIPMKSIVTEFCSVIPLFSLTTEIIYSPFYHGGNSLVGMKTYEKNIP